jgi:superfamily II DNA/RNA helicase
MFAKKIHPALQQGLSDKAYPAPLEGQPEFFKLIKAGAHIICCGEPGTGKRTVLAAGIIQKLQRAIDDVPRAIIATATADEAANIASIVSSLAIYTDLRIFDAHSKPESGGDINEAIYYGADIVAGTPKKLFELYNSNSLNLSGVSFFAVLGLDSIRVQDTVSALDRISESVPKAQMVALTQHLSNKTERYEQMFMKSPAVIEF